MCVSAQTVLEEINDDIDKSVIEQYNDKAAEENQINSLEEVKEETLREELQSFLRGHTGSLFRDYLTGLESEYTVVKTPSGWDKIINLGDPSPDGNIQNADANKITEALAENLERKWVTEGKGKSVGRAYRPDPTDPSVNEEEVVSVTISTNLAAPYTIHTTAYNHHRNMGDLHGSETAKTLEEAIKKATTLANEVQEA
jgi:hypothetical protein